MKAFRLRLHETQRAAGVARAILAALLIGVTGCRSDEERQQDASLHRLVVWNQRRHLDSVSTLLRIAHGADSVRLRAAWDSIAAELTAAERHAQADKAH